ncbi:MAG: ABC transporter ATP-binding protein [Candidatus Riflebacteria bacterium]|nr:ABC transporter ATP-binding protein [Candidatus Riflebacteria bacterium]
MSDPQPVLELRGINRSFGDRRVLFDIDLAVQRGEFIALVGPSGCGKSTLFSIVGGFTDYRDYTGEVRVDGQLSRYPNCEKGIIFQKNVLYPWMNVLDNTAYGLVLKELNLGDQLFRRGHYRAMCQKYRQAAAEYLRKMCLTDADFDKMIYEISGGMQQRVDIACAMVLKPKILLMDEPFSGLDPQTRGVLQALLRSVQRLDNDTIILVTHDLDEAVYVSTRVVVMSQHHGQGPGARIVLDLPIPFAGSADPRREPEFAHLVERIRAAGFSAADRKTLEALGVPGSEAAPPPGDRA